MMDAAGMLRGTRSVYLLVLLVPLVGLANSLPIQLLPSIPGYIPVYIRHGDQPLEDINPDLAEAFHEKQSLRKIVPLDEHDSTFEDDFDHKLTDKSQNRNSISRQDGEKTEGIGSSDEKDDGPGGSNFKVYKLDEDGREENVADKESGSPSEEALTKLSSITDEEKEQLMKLAAEVEKEETRPNDLFDPHYGELPAINRQNNNGPVPYSVLKLIPVSIVQDTPPEPPIVRRLPKQVSNPPAALQQDDKTIALKSAEPEVPVKQQRPAGMLSNVHKLSPIDASGEKSTDQHETRPSST